MRTVLAGVWLLGSGCSIHQGKSPAGSGALAEQPTPGMIERWHRWFAVECNNAAWDLAAKPSRSAADDEQMLAQAYAAWFHWTKVGQLVNRARADLALAHVLSLRGQGSLALHHARRCLAFFDKNGGEDWDLALAHAEMAQAAAVAGDAALHAEHYALAKQSGAAMKDEQDRKMFDEEFARIPKEARPATNSRRRIPAANWMPQGTGPVLGPGWFRFLRAIDQESATS